VGEKQERCRGGELGGEKTSKRTIETIRRLVHSLGMNRGKSQWVDGPRDEDSRSQKSRRGSRKENDNGTACSKVVGAWGRKVTPNFSAGTYKAGSRGDSTGKMRLQEAAYLTLCCLTMKLEISVGHRGRHA